MNIARGLFRVWIIVSVLWIIGGGSTTYLIVSPDAVQGSFQPVGTIKKGVQFEDVATFSKPFYDTMLSPSAEQLSVSFFPLDRQTKSKFDNDVGMSKVDMPDGSRIYMDGRYSPTDKAYIAKQFWDQRWKRWGYIAGIVVLWALIPCVVLLGVGYALIWVGRGFMRS